MLLNNDSKIAMAEEKLTDRLTSMPFFDGLSEEQMDVVSNHLEMFVFEPDEVIFQEGDVGDTVYFIADGNLDVLMQAGFGENVRLATLSTGSSFGGMSIIDDLPRSASVKAITQSTVMGLKKESFERLLEDEPRIGVIMLKGLARFMSEHLRETSESLSDFLEPG